MIDRTLSSQATAVTVALSGLNRHLSTMDADDPTMHLPVAQLRVCGILRDGAMSMSCLSRELGISMSAATQLADRLERSGMVERNSETGDRRIRSLCLTDYGEEVLRARRERRVKKVVKVLEQLSPGARSEVLNGLEVLLEAARVAALESPNHATVETELENS